MAWQLIFFTGFSLGRGWVKVPLDSKPLLWRQRRRSSLLGLVISLPIAIEGIKPIDALQRWITDHSDKTYWICCNTWHFLASAYVAVAMLKGREANPAHAMALQALRQMRPAGAVDFHLGDGAVDIGGMVFDHLRGRASSSQVWVNAVAFALLFAIGYGVAWFKRAPWKRRVGEPPRRRSSPAPNDLPGAVVARGGKLSRIARRPLVSP